MILRPAPEIKYLQQIEDKHDEVLSGLCEIISNDSDAETVKHYVLN